MQCAQAEHCLCPGERQPHTRAPHAILDEVPTCAFDDAGGDRQAFDESAVVVEPGSVPRQVLDALLDGLGGLGGQVVALDHAAHAGLPRGGGMPGEQRVQSILDPRFSFAGARSSTPSIGTSKSARSSGFIRSS